MRRRRALAAAVILAVSILGLALALLPGRTLASAGQEPAVATGGPELPLGRAMLSLLITFGLLGGLVWYLKRRGAAWPAAGRPPTLRGRLSLGRDAEVALVDVGGRILVLGIGGGGVRLLERLPADEPAASADVLADAGEPGGSAP